MKTIKFKFTRVLQASQNEAFSAWLNPKVKGTPWSENDKIILQPKLNGFFYWLINGNHHYGRFTKLQRPSRIEHTWMSRHTSGEESKVTLTFKKKGKDTLMTLVHSGLPKTEGAKGHERGWNYFLDNLTAGFAKRNKRR